LDCVCVRVVFFLVSTIELCYIIIYIDWLNCFLFCITEKKSQSWEKYPALNIRKNVCRIEFDYLRSGFQI
jgi:hypothetical protein